MKKIQFQITKVIEDENGNPKRKTSRKYVAKAGVSTDDILEWFEDTYRDDSPISKNFDGGYHLTRATDTGYVTYILKFVA